jgi:predicted nucleic acid-binding protein
LHTKLCVLPEHREAAGLSEQEVATFLNAVVVLLEPVENHFLWRPYLPDPNDERVLEAAVNGRANAIVTFNARDYGNVPQTLGIDILTPAQALRRLQA